MALTKDQSIKFVTVDIDAGRVEIILDVVIEEDGAVISQFNRRVVVDPGDSIAGYPSKLQQLITFVRNNT